MKVGLCLFTDSMDPSGVGEHMLTLAGLLRDRYRISLVCPPRESCVSLLQRAGELGLDTLGLSVRGDRGAWESLRDWLHEQRVDIFHCHAGIGWEGHHGLYAAHAAGVPVLLRTEHLPQLITEPWQHEDYMRMVQTIDGIICVSEQACATFLNSGVPAEKLHMVRNGINVHHGMADREGARRRLALHPGTTIGLTVGRLAEQKGHEYLIGAIPLVLKRVRAAMFIIVGEGELEGQLRTHINESGLDEHAYLIGRCDYVPDLMAAADLFVLPSLFEGLPLVVLEAMAAGLPVVGTRVCGTSEAVVDGVTGRLVQARNPEALARGILEVLENPVVARQWGAAGRARLEREFSADRMARETAAIYEELLLLSGWPGSNFMNATV